MNRVIARRIERLEQKTGSGSGLAEFFAAIDGLSRGLPSEPVHITPERQAKIDYALAKLNKDEIVKILSDLEALHR